MPSTSVVYNSPGYNTGLGRHLSEDGAHGRGTGSAAPHVDGPGAPRGRHPRTVVGVTTGEVAALGLPAEPASVPRARHFVRDALAGRGPDLQDAAEACISELVTNSVLHARTDLEVRLLEQTDTVRLEVVDRSPGLPRRLVHTLQSATGRGMEIVTLLAEDWGVDPVEGGGKAVWCTLAVAPREAGEELDVDALLASWPDEPDPVMGVWADHDGDPGGGAPAIGGNGTPRDPASDRRVVLVGYPVRRGIRARDHTSAILRECALLSQTGTESAAPVGLVRLAQQITGAYSGELAAVEEQRTTAFLEGRPTVDLRYPVAPGAREIVEAWRRAMDVLDEYAAGAALLTLATPPDLVELREWSLDELIRQSDGLPPRPWTGGLD